MDGWMDGWMDEWMDGWMDEWMDGHLVETAEIVALLHAHLSSPRVTSVILLPWTPGFGAARFLAFCAVCRFFLPRCDTHAWSKTDVACHFFVSKPRMPRISGRARLIGSRCAPDETSYPGLTHPRA